MIRRIGQVTRDSGIMGLLFRVLAQSVYRRLLLLDSYLAEHQFDADPRCRWLGPGDEALYEEFALPGHAERLSQRLAAGQRCWILTTHDQKIGHALWVAFGTASIAYLGFDVPLAADEVYLFDSYTPPLSDRRQPMRHHQRPLPQGASACARHTPNAVVCVARQSPGLPARLRERGAPDRLHRMAGGRPMAASVSPANGPFPVVCAAARARCPCRNAFRVVKRR